MPVEKSYLISELAEEAEVTIRTVRYYVAEGLLPAPQGGGRAATYDDNHLARLKLIKILKDEFLPLQEIRALLSGLDDRAVVELLAEKQAQPAPPLPAPNSAKAYLQTLLLPPDSSEESSPLLRHKLKAQQFRDPAQSRDAFREAPPASTGAGRSLPLRELPLGIAETIPAASAPLSSEIKQASGVERWRRYQITPEVEVHVKEGVDNTGLWFKVEQLIKAARQIMSSIILAA
jgi:DNA-binding transcriptional MerR regulator